MSWHVRYFEPKLHTDLQSSDFETEQEALAAACALAESGALITAVEGPDGEIAGPDAIELWFRERGLVPPPVRPR